MNPSDSGNKRAGFTFTVIDALVAGILFAGFAVQHRLVGHKAGTARVAKRIDSIAGENDTL